MTAPRAWQRWLRAAEPMNVVIQAGSFLVAFPLSLLVARYLGPEGRGVYGLASMTAAVMALIAGLGIAEAAPLVLVRYGRESGADGILARTVWWPAIVGTLLYIAAAPITYPAVGLTPTVPVVGASAALVTVMALWPLWLNLGVLQGRTSLPIKAEAVRLWVYLLIVVALMGVGVLTASLAVVALTVSHAVVIGIVAARIGPTRDSGGLMRRQVRRDAVALGWRGAVARLLEYGATRGDALLIGSILGPTAAGWWVVNVRIGETLLIAANANVPPVLYGLSTRVREHQPWGRFLLGRVLGSGAVALAGAAVILLIGPWLIEVALGEEFLPVLPALQVFVFAVLAIVAARVLRHANFALGHMRTNWFADAVTLLVIVGGNVAFLQTGGLVAAAKIALAGHFAGLLVLAAGLTLSMRTTPAHGVSIAPASHMNS